MPTKKLPPPVTLSIFDAQKLVLLSQQLPRIKPAGRAVAATMAAVRHLGYIQIDTISVIARAHHHTLWNRNRRYQPQQLDQLVAEQKVFEYWSHAAAYLPMENYRFCLPRMRAIAGGQQHWFAPDRNMMKKVLARITADGPLRAQDFQYSGRKRTDMWDWKPAKRALEQLFMEGKLMARRRQGFHKVYDLAERVLPSQVNTTAPTDDQYADFLITGFLRANGIARASEIAYLRTGMKPLVARRIAHLTRQGKVTPVKVKNRRDQQHYYALPGAFDLLTRRLPRKQAQILSPFDNLVIQRKRMQELFNFDYQLECYTPANKRKHGYFALPVLWNGKLVARMDCKAERNTGKLIIRNLFSEPHLKNKPDFADALSAELTHFAAFNNCQQITINKLHDRTMQKLLRDALRWRME